MSFLFHEIFYRPILNLMIFLYNVIPGHSLGVAIIVLTIIIRLVLYPLAQKSIRSQKQLNELQPKLNEIKEKYKNDKDGQAKAMLALYKDNKINPFSSCLPILIQLPFLIGVFRVFRDGLNGNIAQSLYPFITMPETINNIFLGMNLSERSITLAVLAGLAQFWQAKMMMAKRPPIKSEGSRDEDMAAIMNKQMLYVMPVITVFIGLQFPSGLTLYWLLTTLLMIVQQYIVFKLTKKKEDSDKEGKIVQTIN